DRPHAGEFVKPGADRQHRPDPGGAGATDHFVALGGEIGEIEVAMAVDQRHLSSPSCFKRFSITSGATSKTCASACGSPAKLDSTICGGVKMSTATRLACAS